MSEKSRQWLEQNLPEIFEAPSLREALYMLFDLIEDKGFAPPHYDTYNDFGREAQKVYDDLYLSNVDQ